jgi:DNA-binding transcriptional MerR regulator
MASRMAGEQQFSIGDLAREFGVTTRTIRFYEAEGLIRPSREGAARSYSRGDRSRLAWILRGRAVGFSLADIRELLDLYAPGPARRPQMEAAAAKCRARLKELSTQRDAIDQMVAELEQFIASLETQLQTME